MAFFKSNDKDLNLVDNLLRYLKHNIKDGASFVEINDELKISTIQVKFDSKSVILFDVINEKSWETNYYLASCLTYLIQNGFVVQPAQDNYRITFKGIIKLKTNTFSEDGFQSKWGSRREVFLFLFSVTTLILLGIKLFISC